MVKGWITFKCRLDRLARFHLHMQQRLGRAPLQLITRPERFESRLLLLVSEPRFAGAHCAFAISRGCGQLQRGL